MLLRSVPELVEHEGYITADYTARTRLPLPRPQNTITQLSQ